MMTSWSVIVSLVTKSNFGLVSSNIARQARAMENQVLNSSGRMNRSLSAAEQRAQSLQSRMTTMKRVGVAAFDTIGIAAAAAFAIGIKGAADLQQSIAQLAVQSGRTTASIDKQFTGLAVKASFRTGMPLADTFRVIREVSGVIKDRRELENAIVGRGQGGILDLVTVLKRSGVSDADPSSIARNVITLDHILNAYREPEMRRVNERLYRAAVGSHMELNPLVTQVGYFGEQFRLAGGNRKGNVDDILTLAELGYWGIGHGKWGSGFGQILRQVTRLPENSLGAMAQLGVINAHIAGVSKNGKPKWAMDGYSPSTVNAHGEFTPMAMITAAIARTAGMTPMARQALLNQAFPANAARVMAEAMSPKTQGFVQRLRRSEGGMQPLMSAEATLLGNLNDQTERLYNNFKLLSTLLERGMAGRLSRMLVGLNDRMGRAIDWAQAHPRGADAIGVGLAAMTGAIVVRFLSSAHNFLGGVAAIGRHGVHPRVFLGHHFGAGAGAAAEGAAARGGLLGMLARGGAGIAGGFLAFPFLRSILHPVGQVAGGLGRVFGIGGVRQLGEGLPGLLARVFPVLMRIGGVFARLGLRLIPVVGEVLLVAQAFDFLRRHGKDIGKLIGEGIGLLIKNIPKWFKAGWPLIVDAFRSLIGMIVNMLNPANWVGLIKDIGSGIAAGIKDATQNAPKTPPHPVRAGGHGLQRAHAVAGAGGVHVHVTANYQAPHGESDVAHRRYAIRHAKQTAAAVASTLAAAMRTTGTGMRIDPAGPSAFELIGGTA